MSNPLTADVIQIEHRQPPSCVTRHPLNGYSAQDQAIVDRGSHRWSPRPISGSSFALRIEGIDDFSGDLEVLTFLQRVFANQKFQRDAVEKLHGQVRAPVGHS